MTIRFGWGWKIGVLYASFVTLILTLVIMSSKQKFDLVSTDYYKDEIAYQGVLDASKNQAGLSGSLVIRANEKAVSITFPADFAGQDISGKVEFYSPVNKEWDRSAPIALKQNTMTIDRSALRRTAYTMKLSYAVGGRQYYQESNINLSK